jgi:hypothetical protein
MESSRTSLLFSCQSCRRDVTIRSMMGNPRFRTQPPMLELSRTFPIFPVCPPRIPAHALPILPHSPSSASFLRTDLRPPDPCDPRALWPASIPITPCLSASRNPRQSAPSAVPSSRTSMESSLGCGLVSFSLAHLPPSRAHKNTRKNSHAVFAEIAVIHQIPRFQPLVTHHFIAETRPRRWRC